jgi:hypothetical protein
MDREFIELVELFFPPTFWLMYADELEEDYAGAASLCASRFELPEAHDLKGYERRARTESSFAITTEKFSHRGVTVSAHKNSTRSHHHREARGGPVLLTQSFADYPGALAQPAQFRDTLARSRQQSLLSSEEPVREGAALYGIIQHGYPKIGSSTERDQFGFYELAIPNKDCTEYLHVYNLAERYANAEFDPNDLAAMMDRGVPLERQQPASAIFKPYRRQQNTDDQEG